MVEKWYPHLYSKICKIAKKNINIYPPPLLFTLKHVFHFLLQFCQFWNINVGTIFQPYGILNRYYTIKI